MPKCTLLALLVVNLLAADYIIAGETLSRTNATPERLGVFDSRAVAYAFFWTPEQQAKRNEMINTAKAAKAAGDTTRLRQLETALAEEQRKNHRQVFSTAPADEALAAIKTRLPEIQKQAGISTLLSRWDEPALKKNTAAKQVDVTDLLVREFKPTEKQLQTIKEIMKQKPVPLEQIGELHD